MTGCGPQLGVLLLLAVLLQTVVVTITVLHFTAALNSVSFKLFVLSSFPLSRVQRRVSRFSSYLFIFLLFARSFALVALCFPAKKTNKNKPKRLIVKAA